ncbi:MAG: peptidoglycan-binding protein [Acidobacteria bacterium]|nr:peptidoglycan-binding protein [Acidobacteriota bacterium]MBP7476042.1 peptidoglycan-binding protein [Pyrinomonadaceae bacterium]MBP9109722.1 peptidoglycan-binding protein [Pyrinomonadaceae bacterium]
MLRKFLLLVSISLLFATAIFGQATAETASPKATPAPAKKPATFRSTKSQVIEAQTLLKAKKLYNGEATGTSNAEWKASVKTYQGENGLAKTGSLNRATLEKMEIKLTEKQSEIPVDPKHLATNDAKSGKTTDKPDATKTDAKTTTGPKRPAPFQANKDQIIELQTKLKDAKLFTGNADGERSDALKDAIKKYQEANGLTATGGINAATLNKMGITLTEKQKEQVAAQAAYDAAKTQKN